LIAGLDAQADRAGAALAGAGAAADEPREGNISVDEASMPFVLGVFEPDALEAAVGRAGEGAPPNEGNGSGAPSSW
jgi:hypothetical protein